MGIRKTRIAWSQLYVVGGQHAGAASAEDLTSHPSFINARHVRDYITFAEGYLEIIITNQVQQRRDKTSQHEMQQRSQVTHRCKPHNINIVNTVFFFTNFVVLLLRF